MTALGNLATNLVGNTWRVMLFGGLTTLALGAILLAWPEETLKVLAIIFGLQLIAWGLMFITQAIIGAQGGWEAVLGFFSGVLCIIAGVVSLRAPGRTLVLLALFLGCAWLISGIVDITESIVNDRAMHRGLLFFAGAISVLAGIAVMSFPLGSIAALTIWSGIAMIIMGLCRTFMAFDVRKSAASLA